MQRFQDITATIIDQLRERGVSQSELARRLDSDRSTISRWKGGNMEGFGYAKGPELAASLACELLATDDQAIETVDLFIDAYCDWVSGAPFVDTAWERLAPQPAPRSERDAHPWLHLLIVLQLLTAAKRWDDAFRTGWRFWSEEAQQHTALNYRLRGLISEAKEHLSKAARAEVVRDAGHRIGLTGTPSTVDELPPVRGRPPLRPSEIASNSGQAWDHLAKGYEVAGRFAHCPPLDALLQSEPLDSVELVLSEGTYEVPQAWHEFAWLALDNAFQGPSDLFEATKVRLCQADLPQLFSGTCRIQRTTYLRDVVTTQSVPFMFRSEKSGRVIELEQTPEALCKLSSQIGNTFLILTRDHHLVVRYKSRRNRPLYETWVPFGGIVDFQELGEGQNAARSLGELLRRAAARKVREQCQVKTSQHQYLLLGLTLDLVYGLKPDFFGLCFVDLDYIELADRFEPVYGHRPTALQVSLDSVDHFESSLRMAESSWASGPFLVENLALLRQAYPHICKMAY